MRNVFSWPVFFTLSLDDGSSAGPLPHSLIEVLLVFMVPFIKAIVRFVPRLAAQEDARFIYRRTDIQRAAYLPNVADQTHQEARQTSEEKMLTRVSLWGFTAVAAAPSLTRPAMAGCGNCG